MATKCSTAGLAEIAGHEGIVTSPYRDSVGVLTAFVGHTAAAGLPDPHSLPMGVERPISEAMDVFARDIAQTEARVRKAFTVALNQHEFDAACSFDINTGAINRATWIKNFNAGNIAAAKKAFMNWRKPAAIIPRRQKERDLFFGGTYANGGFANVYPADAKGNVLWSKGRRVKVASLPNIPATPPQPPASAPEPIPAPQQHEAPSSKPTGKQAATGAALVVVAAAIAGWWHEIMTWLGGIF